MVVSNVVSLFRSYSASRDWSNQELAEFYRVESALIAVGFHVDTDRGLSDEGDPWFVFIDASSDNVIVHCARVDGAYLIASPAFDSVLRGMDFRSLVESFLEHQPLVLPKADSQDKKNNIRLHPSVLLVALVATAFFKLSVTETTAAEADDISSNNDTDNGQTSKEQQKAAELDMETDRQQTLVVLAAVAVVTGELKFPVNNLLPAVSIMAEDSNALSSGSKATASEAIRVMPSALDHTQREDGDIPVFSANNPAESTFTSYTTGRAMPELLVANVDAGTIIDLAAFRFLDSSAPTKGKADSGVYHISGFQLDEPALHGLGAIAPHVESHSNYSNGSSSSSSPNLSSSSSPSDNSGADDIETSRTLITADTRIVTVSTDAEKTATVISGSLPTQVKVPPTPCPSARDTADEPSTGDKASVQRPVDNKETVTKPQPAPAPEKDTNVDIDVGAILSAVAPFLKINAKHIKYSEDVLSYDDSAQDLINDFMKQERRVATFKTGSDIVLYDQKIKSFVDDVSLITWAFDDGSTISVIGVFDHDYSLI